MNRAESLISYAARNAEMRRRRAEGALLKDICVEFGISQPRSSEICAGVSLPRIEEAASPRRQQLEPKPPPPIRLDAATLAEIAEAKRNPAPPYKGQGSWPA